MHLRFAVGVPGGKRSRVWTLKSHRSEVYAFTRGAGALWKVSMHSARGEQHPTCNLAVTGEFAEGLRRAGVLPNGDRFFDRWSRTPLENGALLAARLLIPFESVRDRDEFIPANISWLRPPAADAGLGISFIFLNPVQAVLKLEVPKSQSLLARWRLENGEDFLAVAGEWPFNPEAIASIVQIREHARRTQPKWTSREIHPEETGLALVAGGEQPDGRHLLIDLDYD